MWLTPKRCYAVSALLDVALHQEKGPVSLFDISQRQKISQSYLELIFSKLRQADIVRSIRGPGGGYKINKELNQLTVAEVLIAIDEESSVKTKCTNLCDRYEKHDCLIRSLWDDIDLMLDNFLKKITYHHLLERVKTKLSDNQ